MQERMYLRNQIFSKSLKLFSPMIINMQVSCLYGRFDNSDCLPSNVSLVKKSFCDHHY